MTDTTSQGDIIQRFFTLKSMQVVRHAVGLLLVASLFLGAVRKPHMGAWEYVDLLYGYVTIVVMLYVNMYVLVPRFFYKGQYLWYLLWLVVAIWTLYSQFYFGKLHLVAPHLPAPDAPDAAYGAALTVVLLLFIPFLLISTAFKLFQRWTADARKISELETMNLETELRALRNQINPHFLFNMLNNINTLVKKDADRASFLIVKLSEFLRYLLYESSETSVFLTAEIKFITDFLGLEKVRRDDFEFTVDYSTEQLRGVRIPPYLLVTLVENAIKHSVDPSHPSSVKVTFHCENKHLVFTCMNTLPAVKMKKTKQSGVGLVNITRRLELLYRQNFVFTHHELDQLYIVNLTLPL